MKLWVLHDPEGRILAASAVEPESDDLVVVRPVPLEDDQTVIEIDAPDGNDDLGEICERMRVDLERRQLVPDDGAASTKA